jgi:hypothetical protein
MAELASAMPTSGGVRVCHKLCRGLLTAVAPSCTSGLTRLRLRGAGKSCVGSLDVSRPQSHWGIANEGVNLGHRCQHHWEHRSRGFNRLGVCGTGHGCGYHRVTRLQPQCGTAFVSVLIQVPRCVRLNHALTSYVFGSGVYTGIVMCHGVLCCLGTTILARLQTVYIILNVL